ncbi:MAG TPA: helix-turn-helix domain-containing protein, partial [Syntrophaceae bacterium]|nr:helix-turn-helix domain-containing protein [Syntrophaceae bacterium]
MPEKPYFSTQDISRLLNVSLSSVSKWIDKGELKAYLTPGGYRRVRRENLVEFMKRYRMPIPPELEPLKRKILI